eukprot:4814752-Alexandrium_andersonii.AAC.1
MWKCKCGTFTSSDRKSCWGCGAIRKYAEACSARAHPAAPNTSPAARSPARRLWRAGGSAEQPIRRL